MKIRLVSGAKKGENGIMTKPHELPTVARNAVLEAAELVNQAKIELSHLRSQDAVEIGEIAEIEIKLADALRWLESVGAQTRPEEL